jgi:hypothetical protein
MASSYTENDPQNSQAQNYTEHLCYRMLQLDMKSCRLSHPGFSDSHARYLALDLPKIDSLRKLDICNCPNLGPEGVVALCDALCHTHVSHLSLENVSLGDKGLQAITQLLQTEHGCRLKFLGLEENGPIEISTWNQFLAVACRKLEGLDLSHNSLSRDHLIEIAKGIRENDMLSSLILSENPMVGAGDGMELLCEALHHNQSLRLLALGVCGLSHRSICALAQSLRQHNCSLQRLYAYGNPLVDLDSRDYVQLRYWLDLNTRGRSFIRDQQDFRSEYLPRVLAKVDGDKPEIIYGLLRQLPHIWLPTNK